MGDAYDLGLNSKITIIFERDIRKAIIYSKASTFVVTVIII